MRILAIERERPTPVHANFHDLLRNEAAALWDLSKGNVIREIWSTCADRHTVIMLECKNGAEARQLLAALPMVRSGLIDFTVHELSTYEGFELLFASGIEPHLIKQEEPAEY